MFSLPAARETMFMKPQQKDPSLGATTDALARAQPPSRDLASLRESFANHRTWRAYQDLDKPIKVLGECREVIKGLRNKASADKPSAKPAGAGGGDQKKEEDRCGLGLRFMFESDFETLRKSVLAIATGREFLRSVNEQAPASQSVLAAVEGLDAQGASQQSTLPFPPPKSARSTPVHYSLREDCSPLQGILLQTMDGESVACASAENNGIFHAAVSKGVEVIQIRLIFHSQFFGMGPDSRVRVWLDGILVPTQGVSVVELKKGETEIPLEIEYPENPKTLVSDQYLICVQQSQRTPFASLGGTNSPHAERLPETDMKKLRKIEKQLGKLEEHLDMNATTMARLQGASQATTRAGPGENGHPSADKGVRRTITPRSPLGGHNIFRDEDESVYSSSRQSPVDEPKTHATPEAGAQGLRQASPPCPGTERSQTSYSSLELAHKNIHNIKQNLQARLSRERKAEEDRMATACERILKLEGQLREQREEVHTEMRDFRVACLSESRQIKDETDKRQTSFEEAANEKLSAMQKDLRHFTRRVSKNIAQEKSLIETRSKEIESRLEERVGGLVTMLEAVHKATKDTSKLVHRRLDQAESHFQSLHFDVSKLGKKVNSMEERTGEFRESVMADISALEEMIHRQRANGRA